MKREQEIIHFARDLKRELATNDPFSIAEYYGINVICSESSVPGFKAHTIRMRNCPTIISINRRFSPISQKLLCAHELGHALLHPEGINHFGMTGKNIFTNVEYEANLFAIALLTEDGWGASINMKLEEMDRYLLKIIMDYNMKLN